MGDIAIQVENLSKAYQLGQIGTGTISRDLERFFVTKVLGREDPFLKIGQTNDRTIKGTSDIVWSLKDLNFEINQGDAVGIIGRNGAGKSTLLKLLSRVTSPTTGSIKVKGRVASLLEVGTGFHPELSGRENIYLNGAILGMRKAEIKRKFDEIVDFAGVERYIDTPVKRYSSGMYVRLAFAVAAHLESEILIVDEVLAVGDAEFQKKCLGKMGDISKGEGRTVLFVSHNMAAVKSLCNKGILLENGMVKFTGGVDESVEKYLLGSNISNGANYSSEMKKNKEVTITNANLQINKKNIADFSNNDTLELFLELSTLNDIDCSVEILIKDNNKVPILFSPVGLKSNIKYSVKKNSKLKLKLTPILPFLAEGDYYIDIMVVISNVRFIDYVEDALNFRVLDNFLPETNWNFRQKNNQGSILLNVDIEEL